MKNVRNTSRRQWKKALLMSFLASAAVLYLTSCSDSPEPIDTRMTSAYTDIQTEQTSPLASAETTAALETTDIAEPPDTDSPPLDPSDEIPQIHTEKEEILETIPYDTIYEYSEEYYEGESVTRISGIDGCKLITVVTTYQMEEVTDVDRTEDVLFLPRDEVIVIGTKETTTYGTIFINEKEVPFETEYEYDPDAYDDEETVVREGANGYTTSEYRITYEKGIEVSRELVSSKVTAPVSRLIRVGTKPAQSEITVTKNEDIVEYDTEYEYDSTLEDGVREVRIAGVNGYTENTYRVMYYHGEEISRELVKSTVHEPQNEVIVIGTKKEETFGMPYIDAAHGGYDYNVTLYYGGSNNHGGIDFGVWYGNPIVSVMSGTVVYAYDEGDLPTSDLRWTYGTYVVVEHENGTRSYYAHLKSRTVSVGDYVSKGEIVGYSGNTGRVSPVPTPDNPLAGTHLHFEIRVWNGSTYVKADPKDYLPRWNY